MLGLPRQARIGPGLGIVVAVGLTTLLASCGSTSSVRTLQSVRTVTTISFKPFGPRAATETDLKTISDILGEPIYWAGARPGNTYEVRRGADGNIFLRYLPPGTEARAKGAASGTKAPFLIIATYPLPDAYGAVVRASKRKGSVAVKIPDKGLAVYATKRPSAYYFAYPGSKYQVGVFAPTAALARKLVLKARVVPVL
jgi:hypothetical protein